jgi:hypothetical protein
VFVEDPAAAKVIPFASWFQATSDSKVNPELYPVVTIPVGELSPKIYSELLERYFLQYEGFPTENSASDALESARCFSRIVPAFPVTVPRASITTT